MCLQISEAQIVQMADCIKNWQMAKLVYYMDNEEKLKQKTRVSPKGVVGVYELGFWIYTVSGKK